MGMDTSAEGAHMQELESVLATFIDALWHGDINRGIYVDRSRNEEVGV